MMLIVMLPPPTTKSALTTSESLARIGLVIKEISRNKQRDTEKKIIAFCWFEIRNRHLHFIYEYLYRWPNPFESNKMKEFK